MQSLARLCLAAAFGATLAAPAMAQQFKSGDITIDQPWARATPRGASVGGAYMVIHNTGTTADRLIGGTSDVTPTVQVHQMSMDQGIMRMREVEGGLTIPPGSQVAFSPSGYHLMLLDIKKPLTKGETIKGTLVFQNAGTIPVTFEVGGFGDTGPGGATGTAAAASDTTKGMNMNKTGQ